MEKTLKNLFDYHRFSGNQKLAALIADTESRYANSISDDDLEFVCAAGEQLPVKKQEELPDV